jgi:hypothetical protein
VKGKILQKLSLFRDEKGLRYPIVVQVGSLRTVVAEMLRRTGMQGDNP